MNGIVLSLCDSDDITIIPADGQEILKWTHERKISIIHSDEIIIIPADGHAGNFEVDINVDVNKVV